MPRVDSIRSEMRCLIHAVPFRQFVMTLENGNAVLIEHPENIAFEPEPEGSEDFYVISGKIRMFSTFSAVSSITLSDRGGAAA
jgi:hypothetical protein